MKLAIIALLWISQDTRTADLEILKTKHVAVQVKINGEGPFRLIFDTGAPITLVSSGAAKKAGLKGQGGLGGLMGMGGQATAETFQVGQASVKDLPVIIMDHPMIKMIETVVGELDGIVGFTFFARFNTVIDYKSARLTFTPRDFKPTDMFEKMQGMMGGLGRRQKRVQGRSIVLGLTLDGDQPVVKTVVPGSAAEAAGLKPGDKITAFDERWVEKAQDVVDVASILPAGESVPIKVERDGKTVELTIKPRPGF